MELGVVAMEGDEIYDWDDLSSRLMKGTEKRLRDLRNSSATKTSRTESQIYIDLHGKEISKRLATPTRVSHDQSQQHFADNDLHQPQPRQQQVPQKRPFRSDEAEALFTLVVNEDGAISRPRSHWDGSPPIGDGPAPRGCHMAYLASPQRQDDFKIGAMVGSIDNQAGFGRTGQTGLAGL